MNRAEHLEWAKTRAIGELDAGSTTNAFASMLSDLNKHEELRGHSSLGLGVLLSVAGLLTTPAQSREWIEGFN